MDKPLLCVSIVLLWMIGLLTYFTLIRYQFQYDRNKGVAVVVDKWTGRVQTVQLNQKNEGLERPKKAPAAKDDGKIRLKPEGWRIKPEELEGIQNKEP